MIGCPLFLGGLTPIAEKDNHWSSATMIKGCPLNERDIKPIAEKGNP
ncbi:unnamed protein product [marine sediment metagenome]|uniref:Uncharacterized protein n=1 Tax=marine sediment metagenome TaxID=412755 RepID=X1BGK1_9ZZZZ